MEKAQPAGVMGVENRSETRRLDAPAATLTITKMTKPATSRHRSRIKGPEMVNFHDLVAGLLAAAASEVGAGVAIFAFALLACWKGRREERWRWRWRLKAMKTTKRNKKKRSNASRQVFLFSVSMRGQYKDKVSLASRGRDHGGKRSKKVETTSVFSSSLVFRRRWKVRNKFFFFLRFRFLSFRSKSPTLKSSTTFTLLPPPS